jgi:hypothetical protein
MRAQRGRLGLAPKPEQHLARIRLGNAGELQEPLLDGGRFLEDGANVPVAPH